LTALFLVACGREDIELAPPKSAPVVVEDCSAAVPEGLLAARPPMGWNGYNTFGECSAELDETKLRETIDALVDSGMQSAGYQYVNLDKCWQLERDSDGLRTFDPVRLPGGIEALANDVHARGLSLGVWASMQDCRGEPGSVGYETVDAERYAAWGVDYVKYVDCGTSEVSETYVSDLANALAATGRPVVLSLAAPPFVEWMREWAQASRTAAPIEATFASIVTSIDSSVPVAAYARPGAFIDPDMLQIGNAVLTPGEERVHFSVWSILSAPLLAGNDLTTMSDETLAVLTNSRLIAVDQDPLGLEGALVRREGDVDILAKPLADCGARAVVLWNRGEASVSASVTWDELWLAREAATVHDLFRRLAARLRAGRLYGDGPCARRRRASSDGGRATSPTRSRLPERPPLHVCDERFWSRRARHHERRGRRARRKAHPAGRPRLRKGSRRARPVAPSLPARSHLLALRRGHRHRRRPGRHG
jgi:alpha-galactosidase